GVGRGGAAPTPGPGAPGLRVVGPPPCLVRPAGGAPARPLPPGLVVSEVDDEAGLDELALAFAEAYPVPAGGVAFPAAAGVHYWVGRHSGRVVATAMATVHAGVNLVELIACRPAVRGRGFGEALTWAATLADPRLPAVLYA